MKKLAPSVLFCILCILPFAARAEAKYWGGYYVSMKASFATPVVHGNKERYSTADAGVTYVKDFGSDFKTDTDSRLGLKPAVGVIFNTPGIGGHIMAEAEYSDLGTMITRIQPTGDTIDTSNISTNRPGQSQNMISDFSKLMNMQTRARAFWGNVYYSLDMGWSVLPYIGAGVGYSTLGISSIYSNGAYFGKERGSFSRLAYGFSAGAEIKISKDLNIDLGYRYSRLGAVEFSMLIFDFNTDRNGGTTSALIYRDDIDMSFATHEITLGARYLF
ncbi:MAG: outer membrane beta-barrel protein [Proteobacteria bacterium]|nr:outer membrane beta-barrel protein [Pseudomonadota bacterium]